MMTRMLPELLLRVAVVLVVATVIVTMMRRSSASLRALMWTASLTGALALPLIALMAPRVEVALLPPARAIETPTRVPSNIAPQQDQHTSVTAVHVPAQAAGSSPRRERSVASAPIATTSSPRHIASNADISNAMPPNAAPAANVQQIASGSQFTTWATNAFDWLISNLRMTTTLLFVWMFGALLLLVRLATSHWRLAAIVSSARDGHSDWRMTVDDVRGELGIRRRVDVRVSNDIDIPAVAGVFAPVLLVPASITWSQGERRDVVLHELAHVARWDALAQLVSNIACATYWFIPLTWYAARHAAALREQACDNVVLRSGTRPSLYAQRLLTFSNAPMSTALEPVALAMARPAHIQRRVLDILDTRARRTRLSASFTTTFIAASLSLVALVAVVEPVSASQTKQAKPSPATQLPGVPSSPVIAPIASTRPSPAAVGAPAATTTSSASTPAPVASVTAADVAPNTIVSPQALNTVVPQQALNTIAPQQALEICKRGTNSQSINTNDDDGTRSLRLTTKGPGCEITIRIEGKPVFNREFTDVIRIDGRGIFDVDVREDGVRHELQIRDNNGRLTRTWRVDGRERPYDAEAAEWFGQVLLAIDRQTAFAVDVRLPMLLDRGGVNAVIAETAQMPSDYARTTYYQALVKARRLTSPELASIVNQSARLSTSDYYSAELLKTIGRQGLADPEVRDGVMRLITRMKSDYYKSESMKAAVSASRPTSGELEMFLQGVGTMESDYYKSETVKVLTGAADLSSAQLSDLLSVAAKMKSDYYITEMLGSVVSRERLDTDKRIAYLTAARSIESDYYRSEALNKLLSNGPPTSGEMDLLFTTISGIKSDTYMGSALDRLLSVRSLREADLLRAETVARSINSDNTQADVLRRIGTHAAATSAVRSAVLRSAESLSRYYREQVEQGVGR